MVFRYCLGMIMSVSTLMIFRGAATPSSVVNLSIDALPGRNFGELGRLGPLVYREWGPGKRPICVILSFRRLNCLHIGVGEAEMVADFVDQHVADDMAERLI